MPQFTIPALAYIELCKICQLWWHMLVGHAGETASVDERCRMAVTLGVVPQRLRLTATSGSFMPQEFQDHMSEAQHQQRLGEMQHSRQTCLLSLLPMPRDILERETE